MQKTKKLESHIFTNNSHQDSILINNNDVNKEIVVLKNGKN